MKSIRWSSQPDVGLLCLRVVAALLLLIIHGLPKVHLSEALAGIEDPFGLGAWPTLLAALFAEVVCPLLIVLGLFTRLACLPIVILLLVAMLVVHPDWSLEQGQFGWLLLTLFGGLALTGPGRFSLDAYWTRNRRLAPLAGGQSR